MADKRFPTLDEENALCKLFVHEGTRESLDTDYFASFDKFMEKTLV